MENLELGQQAGPHPLFLIDCYLGARPLTGGEQGLRWPNLWLSLVCPEGKLPPPLRLPGGKALAEVERGPGVLPWLCPWSSPACGVPAAERGPSAGEGTSRSATRPGKVPEGCHGEGALHLATPRRSALPKNIWLPGHLRWVKITCHLGVGTTPPRQMETSSTSPDR